MKFGHIALRVKDVDKMLDFYCNKLGFSEAFRIKNDDGSLRIVYVHISDNQFIEFCLGGANRNVFNDKEDIGFRHISFTMESLNETVKVLKENGVEFSSEILKMRDNNLAIFLMDPEGNKIELMEIKSDSPHFQFNRVLSNFFQKSSK